MNDEMDINNMKQKSVISNYIYNTIYIFVNICFPLITSMYIARVLLADGVGKVSYAINIVAYFTTFAVLGIPKYAPKEIAKCQDDKEKRSGIFWEIFIINMISTTISIAVYYVMVMRLPVFSERREVMCLMGLQLVFYYFYVDWFYQGMEEYKYISIRNLLVKIISFIMLFLFVRDSADVYIYVMVYCAAIGMNHIYNFIHLCKYIEKPSIKIQLLCHIKPILYLFVMMAVMQIYTQAGVTMLGIYYSDEQVAYYTNASRINTTIITLITSLGTVLLPRLSFLYKQKEYKKIEEVTGKSNDFLFFLSIPIFCGVLLLTRPMILLLFGNAFEPAVKTMQILAFMIPVVSIGNVYGSQTLLIYDKEKQLLFSVVIGLGINIVANLCLIPQYGNYGTAVAFALTEICISFIQIQMAKKYVKVTIFRKHFWKCVVSTFVMSIVILCIRKITGNMLLDFCISIAGGVGTYLVAQYILKDEVLVSIVGEVKKKLNK